ncbi:hypothetical protein ES703_92419 [subsurface metagenome]
MTTTIYKFEQGRLLVHEERTLETGYPAVQSGVPVRIGQVRAIDQVLSVDTDYSKYGLITPLDEVRISGNEIFVVMRRGDMGTVVTSGLFSGISPAGLSGMAALGLMSGITSGLGWGSELVSGRLISGVVKVTANVIGY